MQEVDWEEPFRKMLAYVPRRRWADLERDYAATCGIASGRRTADAIAATDTDGYQDALSAAVAAAVRRAVLLKAPAVYVEYDPINSWNTFFALLRKRDNGKDLNWLQDIKDHWQGPGFPPFARLWPRSLSEKRSTAAAAYLAARSLAAFGRACDGLDSHGITIYFARHEDYDSVVPVCPGGRPDYTSIPEKERRRTLRAEAAERAREAAERLGALVGSDVERQALRALAEAGARMGKYPQSPTGVDYVYLENTKAGDDVVAHVASLRTLRALTLSRTKVTDAGLRHVSRLRQLQALSLNDTRVTDAGLVHLTRLTRLKHLGLSGTAVSDAGIVDLKSLAHVEALNVTDTAVTQEGAARLRASLPRTEVMWFGR